MSIVFCQCKNARLIGEEVLQTAAEAAKGASGKVYVIDDLCALAEKQDPSFKQWAAEDDLTIMACFPRAVASLFVHAGAELPEFATLLNLRVAQGVDEVNGMMPPSQDSTAETINLNATDPKWEPWFPLIAYDRCKNCKQCLNFCLFGVYALADEGQVRVAQPRKCKTGCPACARVCPFAAIIFPKYDKSPINGDAVDESLWKQSHAESAESLKDRLGGNIYQMLRRRQQPDAADPRSLDDLKQIKEQFDIPDHLFNGPKE